MSDTTIIGVLRMPYELAMEGDLARIQFHARAQEAADRIVIDGKRIDMLVDELNKADKIINAMLNSLTLDQKCKLASHLEEFGISPDGMTRASERGSLLKAFNAN